MLSPYQRIRNRDQRKISASIDQTPLTNKTKHFLVIGCPCVWCALQGNRPPQADASTILSRFERCRLNFSTQLA